MDTKAFDWYEDTIEVETPEFHPKEQKKTISQKLFDTFVISFEYIAGITFLLRIFRYIFNLSDFFIYDMHVDTLLLCIFVYFGSLPIITNILRCVFFLTKKLVDEHYLEKVQGAYRWIALTIWYCLNLYLIQFIQPEIKSFYEISRAYLQCGFLTSLSFTVITITMEFFYEYFLQKSMFAKMCDVEMRERILATFKNYRYELSESSSSVSHECSCADLFFCFEKRDEDENEEHIELRKYDNKRIGNLYMKPPELTSLYDAKTLARDVFEKVAEGSETLNFDKFASVFPNDQIALQALPFFEQADQEITKRDFRDTVVNFYVDRINLEKNFDIAKGFVNIVGDVLTIVVFGFLILAYLVIFGIPLKELVALALSSALLLNFLISGAATDLYFNFMVLLSHPFDIGDDVIIDNEDFRVYKIGLASTSFIGPNGGKVKFLNSILWKKNLINMTRAPEKIIIFNFDMDPSIDVIKFQLLKTKIHKYLRARSHDFYETFSLQSKSEQCVNVNKLECSLVLRCKSYKTKAKKFNLRVEVTNMIQELFRILEIKTV